MTTKTRAPRTSLWHFTATTPDTTDTVQVQGTKAAATDFAHKVFAFRGLSGYELTVSR